MSDKKKKSQAAVAGDAKAAANGGHAPKTNGSIAMQLLADPDFMNAVNSDLGSLVGKSSGYIESLPTEVQRRIRALKKQQAEFFSIESKFYEEVHALEVKYAAQYESLWQKRHQFVSGEQEPTEEECDWKLGEVENVSEQLDSKLDFAKRDATKGIPGFWLGALKAVPFIADSIKQYDEPILEFLSDIRVKLHPAEAQQNQSFELEFEFAANPHFTNQVLTKKYVLRPGPDPETPLDYEGPEIISSEGCKIDWKAGKNVTVKVMKRKPKNKKGPKRVITETVKQRSFFGFFSPPQAKEGEELDEDAEDALHEDFELGHYIRERIVPRAVLYFTGEAAGDESDFEDGDDEDEDDDEDDEDDED